MWQGFTHTSDLRLMEVRMITIFNRRELCTTFDQEHLSMVRSRLEASGIDYRIRTGGVTTAGRYHGVAGIDSSASYQYSVYVRKQDLPLAQSALR